jgi:hypothetical protein
LSGKISAGARATTVCSTQKRATSLACAIFPFILIFKTISPMGNPRPHEGRGLPELTYSGPIKGRFAWSKKNSQPF